MVAQRHLALLVLLLLFRANVAVVITLESPEPVNVIGRTYVSTNVDPSCNRGFHHTDFSNPNLLAALTALAPSRLRFGGSGADSLIYGMDNAASLCAGTPSAPAPPANGCSFGTPGCLNASHWDSLYHLANASGTEFIFGVSYGGQHSCSSTYEWANSTGYANAQNLLAYLTKHSQYIYGYEVGNEVNLGAKQCNSTPGQQARALVAFHALAADSHLPGGPGAIIGPDTGDIDAQPWLSGLLPLTPQLTAATTHQYNGAVQSNWDSPAQLDSLLPEILWFPSLVRSVSPSTQIWGGEMGPHGGGENGTCLAGAICGTYASSIWFADDLALRAKHGYHHYQRQDLFGGAYGLTRGAVSGNLSLNAVEGLTLLPDFWTAFLWKRTLGLSVLNVSSSSPTVRAYAFTGPPPSTFAAPNCTDSGSQYLLINLAGDAPSTATLSPSPPGSLFSSWTLGAGAQGVFGPLATVNGVALPEVVDVGTSDPNTFLRGIAQTPIQGEVQAGVVLPPHTTTFVCVSA
jgi:hypothetical protein